MLPISCEICGSKRTLQEHHIIPTRAGGTNTRDNLMLLCAVHHHEIHEIIRTKYGHDYHEKNLVRSDFIVAIFEVQYQFTADHPLYMKLIHELDACKAKIGRKNEQKSPSQETFAARLERWRRETL